MTTAFKVGDHVRWNSEAGWVSGIIIDAAHSVLHPMTAPARIVDGRLSYAAAEGAAPLR